MSKTNLASILDKPSNEVERPKPLPAGTYLTVIKGIPRQDKSSQKQTPFLEFTFGVLGVEDDVDEEELDIALTDAKGDKTPITEKTIRDRFYLTENSLFMLTDFLKACGLDTDTDASVAQLVEQAPGSQVKITLKHEATQDGENIRAVVQKYTAAE